MNLRNNEDIQCKTPSSSDSEAWPFTIPVPYCGRVAKIYPWKSGGGKSSVVGPRPQSDQGPSLGKIVLGPFLLIEKWKGAFLYGPLSLSRICSACERGGGGGRLS